jgi:hypothetical protein
MPDSRRHIQTETLPTFPSRSTIFCAEVIAKFSHTFARVAARPDAPKRRGAVSCASVSLTAFERMGDGRPRRIRGSRVRDLSARQRGIRIYLQREGDQR